MRYSSRFLNMIFTEMSKFLFMTENLIRKYLEMIFLHIIVCSMLSHHLHHLMSTSLSINQILHHEYHLNTQYNPFEIISSSVHAIYSCHLKHHDLLMNIEYRKSNKS